MGNVLSASFQSYQDGELTQGEWYDSLNQNLTREHQKDIANLLGVDPDSVSQEGMRQLMAQVAEAYEIAVFITDDPDSRETLTQFAKDLVGAQSSIDWAYFSGVGVFEIVLTATATAAGNIAHAATQLRHAARLRALGDKFRKLAALLQGKKQNKTITAPVDQRTSTSVDQPDMIDLQAKNVNQSGTTDSIGDGARYERSRDALAEVPGTLSNRETRAWYLSKEMEIPGRLDTSKPLEYQARQAFEIRNDLRSRARDLMADQDAANHLRMNEPNLTWDELVSIKSMKYSGDDLWGSIIDSSQNSREAVNARFNFIGDRPRYDSNR